MDEFLNLLRDARFAAPSDLPTYDADKERIIFDGLRWCIGLVATRDNADDDAPCASQRSKITRQLEALGITNLTEQDLKDCNYEKILPVTRCLLDMNISQQYEKSIARKDSLLTQQASFKAECKSELKSLKADISRITASQSSDNLHDLESKDAVELAEINRQIVECKRQLDSVPDSEEMHQYHKRLHELYAHIGSSMLTLRQSYIEHNALVDVCTQLAKERELIDSVSENFPKARQSRQNEAKFSTQMTEWISQLEVNYANTKTILDAEKSSLSDVEKHFLQLLDMQRKYPILLKQIHEAAELKMKDSGNT